MSVLVHPAGGCCIHSIRSQEGQQQEGHTKGKRKEEESSIARAFESERELLALFLVQGISQR